MLISALSVQLAFLALAFASPLEVQDTCNHDNVLRCLISASATATPYCSSYLSLGVVTSYTATTTPKATATKTITVTVTSPVAKLKRAGSKIATTIYAGSPITIVGPGTTSVVVNRRDLDPRATSAPPPSCLPQYSAPASRLTSACQCLSITSKTISTISKAPTTTTTRTATKTSTVAPPSPSTCQDCNVCTSDADCLPGYECDSYVGFSFGTVDLCTTDDIESSSDICSAVCTVS